MGDHSQQLLHQVTQAYQDKTPLQITGSGSKSFYGRQIQGEALDTRTHSGIINYEPSELVITARAGTPLREIEQALLQEKQMLGFEPPAYGDQATLGGTIACNLSGPARAYHGAARDYVLGSRIINGKAEAMHFGGEVMKNVAGYDVSRLMCGAMGTLGVILDVSLKVIPMPEQEITLVHECDEAQALEKIHHWVLQGLPLSASCYNGKRLYIRLASSSDEIAAAQQKTGGDKLQNDCEFWRSIKEQSHDFFNTDQPIWRLSLASNAEPLPIEGSTLHEWGGALRWLRSDESADKIRHVLELINGHATLFRNNATQLDPFHELSSGVFRLHNELKQAFDPDYILNPGRMYAEL